MKKNLLLFAACILLAGAVSCQKEAETLPDTHDMVELVLDVTCCPEPGTRSYLDDASALSSKGFALYTYMEETSQPEKIGAKVSTDEPGGDEPGGDEPTVTYKYIPSIKARMVKYYAASGRFTMRVSVMKDAAYHFVMVAQSAEAKNQGYFTVDPEIYDGHPCPTLTVGELPLNSASADLFVGYAKVSFYDEEAMPQVNLPLKRPLAQINLLVSADGITEAKAVGATDDDINNLKVSLTVTGAPNVLNLLDGSVSYPDEPQEINFAETDRIKGQQLSEETADFQWLASGYVLAPEGDPAPVTLFWTASHGDFSYSPYEPINGVIARYNRTNIAGHILSKQ